MSSRAVRSLWATWFGWGRRCSSMCGMRQTATEDLELLLTGEAFKEPAAGAICVTCNGRGKRLFGKAGHDSTRIAAGLFPEVASPAIAGMFGAGEIGPVGDRSYLHGHSACVAILRPGREAFDAG